MLAAIHAGKVTAAADGSFQMWKTATLSSPVTRHVAPLVDAGLVLVAGTTVELTEDGRAIVDEALARLADRLDT